MSLLTVLASLRSDPTFMANVVTWRTQPARAPRYAPLPPALHPALQSALQTRGINQLYRHQAQAVELALNGHDRWRLLLLGVSQLAGGGNQNTIDVLEESHAVFGGHLLEPHLRDLPLEALTDRRCGNAAHVDSGVHLRIRKCVTPEGRDRGRTAFRGTGAQRGRDEANEQASTNHGVGLLPGPSVTVGAVLYHQ